MGGKGGKPPPTTTTPHRVPRLVLTQLSADKREYVELTTEPGALASRATAALEAALHEHAAATGKPPPPLSIRGITRNTFTGEIHLHLVDQASVAAALALPSDVWVCDINPQLNLRRKIYPIIIHGMPTTFRPSSKVHVHDFIEESHGVLDTATKFVWANRYSIESGKPFCSMIVHLTDPVAANEAIRNRICFNHLLKVTERSTKRIKQCYKCLDFGHFAKACTETFRSCSHCARAHPFDECPSRAEPLCCVNCAQKFLETTYPGISTVTPSDLSVEQRKSCTHSPFSNSCPLRRKQVAHNAHISDIFDVDTNE